MFARCGVRYLFIGKSGAILLGFPDTTQDAVLFVEKSPANGAALVTALRHLGFALILIRFQDESNSGRVSAWQDHAGLIHSLLSGRN